MLLFFLNNKMYTCYCIKIKIKSVLKLVYIPRLLKIVQEKLIIMIFSILELPKLVQVYLIVMTFRHFLDACVFQSFQFSSDLFNYEQHFIHQSIKFSFSFNWSCQCRSMNNLLFKFIYSITMHFDLFSNPFK